jgi:hypothetical protein
MRCVQNYQGINNFVAPEDGFLGVCNLQGTDRNLNLLPAWNWQVHKNLTYLTVAAVAIYGVLWLLGSEGTAALGLSQEVAVPSQYQGSQSHFSSLVYIDCTRREIAIKGLDVELLTGLFAGRHLHVCGPGVKGRLWPLFPLQLRSVAFPLSRNSLISDCCHKEALQIKAERGCGSCWGVHQVGALPLR